MAGKHSGALPLPCPAEVNTVHLSASVSPKSQHVGGSYVPHPLVG